MTTNTNMDKAPLPVLEANGHANPLYDTDSHGNIISEVEEFSMGLSWEQKGADGKKTVKDKAKRWVRKQQGELATEESDLDAGAAFFVAGNKPTKYLGFDNFNPFKDELEPGAAQSAVHSGDNQTGAGDGDDETITLRLKLVPRRFVRILIMVGAFKKGSDVEATTDMKATIYDNSGGTSQAMAVIEPSLLEDKQILPVARLDRVPGTDRWTLTVCDGSFNITQGDMKSLLRASMNAMAAH